MPSLAHAPDWLRRLHDGDASGAEPEVAANLQGLLRGWREWADAMDFLHPDSPNFAWKQLETRLYEATWGDALEGQLDVLDAACGSGRMLHPLAQAGHRVVGVDACLPSLEAAEAHLDGLPVELHWHDVRAWQTERRFDRVLALELLCYLPDPVAAARHLTTMLRPGGLLICSVEAWPGALLADSADLDLDALDRALATRVLEVPDERWVRASGSDDLAAILRAAGLDVLSVRGTHYLPDGPLSALMEPERCGDEGYIGQVIDLERRLRSDPSLSALPRAWLALARRPR